MYKWFVDEFGTWFVHSSKFAPTDRLVQTSPCYMLSNAHICINYLFDNDVLIEYPRNGRPTFRPIHFGPTFFRPTCFRPIHFV